MRVLLIDINPFMAPVTPISLGNVGAVLKSLGHDVRVLSLGSTSRFSPAGLAAYLREYTPQLVGLGAYQRNMLYVRSAARMVRATVPNARIVIGGPQATFLPDAALRVLPEIDYVSRGEGELTIRAIAEAIEGGNSETAIPGVTLRTGDGQLVTGLPLTSTGDLDIYPSPWATGVLDPSTLDESIMLTSRGCRNHCTFCITPRAFGKRIRSQSVDRVLDDITIVASAGTGRMWFADPNFSFSEERVAAILEGILRRGLNVSMWIETRADMVNPELLALLKRVGVHTMALGLESASPNVAPGLNKGINPEAIGRAAREALATGLDVEFFSQYALPGERLEDAMATLKYVKDCGVKIRGNSNAQQMQIYFGSEICSHPREFGVRPLRENLPPYLAIGKEFETAWMSRKEIEQVRNAWLAESLDGGKRVVS
jgi:radical SAM superfamily enzyme YgiQ (UPF0313 family)